MASYHEARAQARLVSPLRGNLQNYLTSGFGHRAPPKTAKGLGSRFHAGYDFGKGGVTLGTPVYASHAGTLNLATTPGYGNLVTIAGPGGISTKYAHLSKFAQGLGQYVNAGDLIGYVGSTGKSTGPHLHWAVLRNGKPIQVDLATLQMLKAKGEVTASSPVTKTNAPQTTAPNQNMVATPIQNQLTPVLMQVLQQAAQGMKRDPYAKLGRIGDAMWTTAATGTAYSKNLAALDAQASKDKNQLINTILSVAAGDRAERNLTQQAQQFQQSLNQRESQFSRREARLADASKRDYQLRLAQKGLAISQAKATALYRAHRAVGNNKAAFKDLEALEKEAPNLSPIELQDRIRGVIRKHGFATKSPRPPTVSLNERTKALKGLDEITKENLPGWIRGLPHYKYIDSVKIDPTLRKKFVQRYGYWKKQLGGDSSAAYDRAMAEVFSPDNVTAEVETSWASRRVGGNPLILKPKTSAPPVKGARKAPDGHWYVKRAGKWYRVEQ